MTHNKSSRQDLDGKTRMNNNRVQYRLEEYGLSFLDIAWHEGFDPILRAFFSKMSETIVKAIQTSTLGLPKNETWEEVIIDNQEHNFKNFS